MTSRSRLCRMIGAAGSVIYVGGFAALQMHWIGGKGLWHSRSKILGARFLLISLSVDFNLASAITQVFFLGFCLMGLGLRLKERNTRMRSRSVWGAPNRLEDPT
ncbi:CBU_0592 family membrane protein [Celeribacter ethanolicus]|uniref:CBU_0592 family membrane protein n=1 Tax=Celeribacter ethanolicus TaxID=1758178 RepID=UPI000A7EDB6C|nr:hypothetical protein [Celeribacter ethanolicus]TNE69025.1 MAG: hypothetical protein EP336_03385 [Paracoccaceae bacterium]